MSLSQETGYQMINRAWEFAAEKHSEQNYGQSCIPHAYHRADVAGILVYRGHDAHVISAGILHDVVEDTSVTLDDIADNFPEPVVEGVEYTTYNPKATFLNLIRQGRAMRSLVLAGIALGGKGRFQTAVAKMSPIAHAVKHADSTCNLLATYTVPDDKFAHHQRRYDSNLVALKVGLPKPENVAKYIQEKFAGQVALGILSEKDRQELEAKFTYLRYSALKIGQQALKDKISPMNRAFGN